MKINSSSNGCSPATPCSSSTQCSSSNPNSWLIKGFDFPWENLVLEGYVIVYVIISDSVFYIASLDTPPKRQLNLRFFFFDFKVIIISSVDWTLWINFIGLANE